MASIRRPDLWSALLAGWLVVGVAHAAPVEVVTLDAERGVARSRLVLADGALYLLRASGACTVGAQRLDAERAGEADLVAGLDVGIDVGRRAPGRGIGRAQPPPGPGRMKWHAGPDASYLILVGDRRPLTLTLVKPPGPARGALAVAIYPLGPPPALGPALDLVRVPVQKLERTSRHVPAAGAIYVLEAAGVGAVGGGGLKVGDAEYMDFAADGSGRNEGEAGVDFGIGVDEPVVKLDLPQGSAHAQRRHWWGPFRADHVYYTLYTGTGQPVSFTYHDTGYGDNSRTDALVVRLYRAP